MLVVVNSTIYGGSGGGVGTYSLANGATEIAIHEMGHTAFGLADDIFITPAATRPTRSPSPHEPSEPNVTINTNRNSPKWRWAVLVHRHSDDEQPGVQHGGHASKPGAGRNRGIVRRRSLLSLRRLPPEYDCKMRALSVPFCRVCRQTIWNRIGPLATLQARPRTPISVVARYP